MDDPINNHEESNDIVDESKLEHTSVIDDLIDPSFSNNQVIVSKLHKGDDVSNLLKKNDGLQEKNITNVDSQQMLPNNSNIISYEDNGTIYYTKVSNRLNNLPSPFNPRLQHTYNQVINAHNHCQNQNLNLLKESNFSPF